MTLFIDTSALYAYLDSDAAHHDAVKRVVLDMGRDHLVTHGYVAAESLALVRRRLGSDAAVRLVDDGLMLIDVRPVERDVHGTAVAEYRATGATGPSFVDRVSFAFMRRERIDTAIAVDRDFLTAGFRVLPEPDDLEG